MKNMAMIEINFRPDRTQLRTFGWIALAAFGALGAWVFFRHAIFGFSLAPSTAQTAACTLWVVAGLCATLAALAPSALRPLYLALSVIALPIGLVISHVLMAAIYYLVFTPIGLFFRAIGRDPLHRRFDPRAESYWVRRTPPASTKRYFRQF